MPDQPRHRRVCTQHQRLLRVRKPVPEIRTPLFVLQGANDVHVPQSDTDQLVSLLTARGIEVRYHVYPDEGHGFVKSSNQIRADSDAADFLSALLTTDAARNR